MPCKSILDPVAQNDDKTRSDQVKCYFVSVGASGDPMQK